MRMTDMDLLLEDNGFTVQRRYMHDRTAYEFTIRKDGLAVIDHFIYPENVPNGEKDKLQHRFIELIMDKWFYTHRDLGPAPWLKKNTNPIANDFKIKKVIFNDPATVVFWTDGTKTVVKAQNEDFDPEKGLAMAIAKKALGNQGNYCNEIKKWTEPYFEERSLIDEVISNVRQATAKLKHHVDQSNLRAARHFLKQALVPKTTKSVMTELIEDSIEALDKVLDE